MLRFLKFAVKVHEKCGSLTVIITLHSIFFLISLYKRFVVAFFNHKKPLKSLFELNFWNDYLISHSLL